MPSNFKISTAARNAAADAIVDLIDAGTPPGTLKVFANAPPANVSDADDVSLLGTLTFSATAFGAAAAGAATAAAITSDIDADASGTAGHFRVKNQAGTTIMQGTAGETDQDMIFGAGQSVIVAGGTIACSSFVLTVPIQ